MDETGKLELLDFWAVWCGPCKIMDPVLEEIEHEYEGRLVIRKLNVDEEDNQALVHQYQVLSIPTYIILKDGQMVASFIGVQPKATLTAKIDSLLEPSQPPEATV